MKMVDGDGKHWNFSAIKDSFQTRSPDTTYSGLTPIPCVLGNGLVLHTTY